MKLHVIYRSLDKSQNEKFHNLKQRNIHIELNYSMRLLWLFLFV